MVGSTGYYLYGTVGVFVGAFCSVITVPVVLRHFGRQKSRRMEEHSFAVHDTVAELSAEERAVLRATGQVPGWFLTRVEERRRPLPT